MMKLTKAFFILLISFAILLLILLQIHNLSLYPVLRGFDAPDHINYANFLRVHKSLPLPAQGWEMYHPPLYYLIASFLPNIEFTKLIGFAAWLVLGIVSFKFFRKVFSNNETYIASLLVVSLPAIIFLTPEVSNEFFSAVMISTCLVFYFLQKENLNRRNKLILGVLLGLSLLAKSTAIVLLAAILIDQIVDSRFDLYLAVRKLFLPFLVVFVIAGWFYIRNGWLYGNPLISNPDLIQKSRLAMPSDRSAGFWFDLSAFQKLDLFQAHHYSFPGGTYFSFFYDGQNSLIPVQKFSVAGDELVLAALPLALTSLVGFCTQLRSKKSSIFLIYVTLLVVSYIAYNFKYPYFFSVKGFYMVSLVIPWAYYFIYGLKKLNIFLIFIYLDLALYEALILKNFWILNSWH